jgi:TIR domain
MTAPNKDIFISYATKDKDLYILPLQRALDTAGITYWLDTTEINWGDNFVAKINEGLSRSEFVLLCLSKNFLERPWPESEFYSALAIQNTRGVKRILPLVCDSKDEVMQKYPLLASLVYKEWHDNPGEIAIEIRSLLNAEKPQPDVLQVLVASAHTGKVVRINVNRRASIAYLEQQSTDALGVSNELRIGEFTRFRVRYIIVDINAKECFQTLPKQRHRDLFAVVATQDGIKFAHRSTDRLGDVGFYDGIEVNLYPVEAEDQPRELTLVR